MIITREKGMRMWGGGSGNTSVSGASSGGGFSLTVAEGEGSGNAYTDFTYESGKLILNKATEFVTVDFFNKLFTAYDANGNVIAPNNTTPTLDNIKFKAGAWTEQYLSALGQNTSGGGGGGGDVSSIIFDTSISYHTGTPVYTATDGVIHLPPYPTSVTWANVTGKPSWIGSSKPTYAIGEIQNSALSGNGFLKKTGTNTWGIDTNTYALTSDVYSSSASRTANTVLAAPNGSAGAATFRALVAADIPSLAISKITNLQTTLDAKALKTTTISAGNGLTGGGDLSSNRELAIQLQSNSGLSVSSSGLKLDIINNLTTESAYKAISATQAKKIWDLLNQMFTLEGAGTTASPYVIKANYGLYTEQFLSALGQNSSGGGTGGGTVTGIKLVSGNAIQPDTDGIVTLPSATSSVYGVVKLGTSSTTAATGNHTHALSIAADSGTNQLSLTANTKYKLTAGGSTFIFTTPSDTTYSAGTGLSLSGTTINHSNSVTAKTTQAVYPIKIDAQGHISAYGSAVSLGTASSHAHTDYVTAISWDSTNNNLAWSKGGTAQTAITIGYATSAGTASKVGSSTLGSATKPIYLSSGTATECSTYAGGTAVTLNGTSKAASTASFYAPTASGTANQVLISGGANTAPSWTAQSNLSVGSLTTVSKTAWGQTYWTSGGVPATISGDLSSVGNIYMSNNKHIYAKKYNDTDTNVSLLYLSTGNTLVLGSGTVAVSSNTLVYGGTSFCVRIGGTGSDTYNALLIDTSKNTTLNGALSVKSGITLTTTKKIYFGDTDHYLELNSTGFHFSHGVYSDSFVSALGANSSGGGGGGGTVTGIKLASNSSAIQPDANGIITIPAATTSAFGVVKVGSTLSVSSGTLNLKASGVTANTYTKVTVDTYGRVTAGTNPTTLAGYGITDAYTKTASDGRFMRISDYTDIGATSSSTVSCNSLTTYGVYKNGSTSTASSYVTERPVNSAIPFRLVVERTSYASNPYIRQRYQSFNSNVVYERYSSDTGANWSDWVKVQDNLANYALASSLSNYLPLSGGTMNNGVAICWKDKPSSGTASDLSLVSFSTTNNFHLGYDAATLGYNTYISGNNIYLRYGTSRTTGLTLASDGTVTVANDLALNSASNGYQTTKGINFGSVAHIGASNTGAFGLYATAGIYIRPDVTLNASSTNGIVLTSTAFTYNGNTVLHAGNSYVTSGKGYINGTEITTISGNAATATTATKLSTVSKTAWGQTYWTSGGVPTDISGNLSSVGNIYMANAKTIFIQDTDGTDRSVLNFSSNNNINLGYGTYNLGTGTYIYGKTLVVRIGGTAASANAVQVDESKNMTVTGYVAVGSGGANSRLVSDAADNIYLANSSGIVLVCKAKVVRRGSSMADVTLGSSSYPWGGLYSTTGDFSSTLSVTGASTLTGNITAGGDIYLSNAKYIRANNSSGTAEQLMGMNGSNQLLIGYGHRTSGSTILYGLSVTLSTNGTSRLYVLSNGNVGIANSSPSEKLHVTGNILASGEVTASSDERKKNIISNTKFSVKDIASARSILYEWNDDRDKDNEKKIHGGSIAQDWLGKADSFLSQDNDGWYSINYGALALCSAITIAKEVVKHEDEITRLKKEVVKLRERVAELEERRA